MHCFPGHDSVIEADGHVGHGAVLHGCTVERNAMVGMNAVVMDGAVIGEDSFVGGHGVREGGHRGAAAAPGRPGSRPRSCAS